MSRTRTAALTLAVVVVATGSAAGAYAVTDLTRPDPVRSAPARPPSPPPLLAAAAVAPARHSGAPGTMPSAAAVRKALTRLAAAPGLGGRLRAYVSDVLTGRVLYSSGGAAPVAPASTAKLLTAVAILSVRAPADRITTTVRSGRAGAVVLVGGGDPTLTGARTGRPGAYGDAARISDLAAQLTARHIRPDRIVVDDSAFAGPAVSPDWAPEDVPSGYASAITATMTDGGRVRPSAAFRSARPDLAAGRELATALAGPGLRVVRGRAAPAAKTLASVQSAPIGTLVEQMLQQSDNVIAECLGRQVALAKGLPPTFRGAARAIRRVLATLGLHVGTGMRDASGLSAGDRLTSRLLTTLLHSVAVAPSGTLRTVSSSLPVAGWSGTLANRFAHGGGGGVIRAKTGTLTAVSALAGFVHDRSGRSLAFAFIADRAGPTPIAERALDNLATRLAKCGCRS